MIHCRDCMCEFVGYSHGDFVYCSNCKKLWKINELAETVEEVKKNEC